MGGSFRKMSKDDDVTALSSQLTPMVCTPDFKLEQAIMKCRTAISSVMREKMPREVELVVFTFQEQDAKCIPIMVTKWEDEQVNLEG